jgi:hypothetical protein
VNDSCDLRYTDTELAAGPIVADLGSCLVPGANVVQWSPSGPRGSARVAVLID